ncbi:CPBP family intramembrane metalloprotease [Akkermansiaceae bacterium]|nr:CPBP family intramembrane metalloprotease [Akkermansiaceae bacterium]
MTPAEHGILGFILMVTAVAFFVIAVPGYWVIRNIWPQSGWNLGGSIATSCFKKYDLLVVGALVLYYGIQWKLNQGQPFALEKISVASVISSSVFYLILAAAVPFLLFRRTHLAEFFGIRWAEWRWIFMIIPVFLIAIFICASLLKMTGWHDRISSYFGSQVQESVKLIMTSHDIPLLLAITFSAVIVAPIAEEVIFRGYLYPVAKRYSEKWFATIFSAMLFGVVHMNLLGLPMLILIGLALVLLYEKTGSIWPCILCHMAFNGFSIGMIFLARFLKLPFSA